MNNPHASPPPPSTDWRTPQVFGYLRQSRTEPSVETQREAIAPLVHHAEQMHVDVLPETGAPPNTSPEQRLPARERMLGLIRPGDAVLVYSLGRLGLSEADIARTISRVIDRGAAVRTVATSQTLDSSTSRVAVSDAARDAATELRRQVMGHAQRSAKARGIKPGPARMLQGAKREAARILWHQHPERSQRSIADEIECSIQTLRREFGARECCEEKE